MNQSFLLILAILLISCSENLSREKKYSSKIKEHSIVTDSITNVDICYYPSFTNSSALRLNRITGEGLFTVDTAISFSYGKPDTLKFIIKDMEAKIDIESFWNSSFIHLIKQDTSMIGWTDGMPVLVMFTNNDIKDSVYLGNVFPKAVDSLLMRQFQFLESRTNNRPMKVYLKQIKGYL